MQLSQQRRHQAEIEATEVQPKKLQQLTALGIASEEVCKTLLMKHGWNVEAAGSELAERFVK